MEGENPKCNFGFPRGGGEIEPSVPRWVRGLFQPFLFSGSYSGKKHTMGG